MQTKTLELIKQRIIKTDEVLKIYVEKRNELDRQSTKYQTLVNKYDKKCKENAKLKIELNKHQYVYEQFKNALKFESMYNELNKSYTDLEFEYGQRVNNLEFKYQSVNQELQDNIQKYEEQLKVAEQLRKVIKDLESKVKKKDNDNENSKELSEKLKCLSNDNVDLKRCISRLEKDKERLNGKINDLILEINLLSNNDRFTSKEKREVGTQTETLSSEDVEVDYFFANHSLRDITHVPCLLSPFTTSEEDQSDEDANLFSENSTVEFSNDKESKIVSKNSMDEHIPNSFDKNLDFHNLFKSPEVVLVENKRKSNNEVHEDVISITNFNLLEVCDKEHTFIEPEDTCCKNIEDNISTSVNHINDCITLNDIEKSMKCKNKTSIFSNSSYDSAIISEFTNSENSTNDDVFFNENDSSSEILEFENKVAEPVVLGSKICEIKNTKEETIEVDLPVLATKSDASKEFCNTKVITDSDSFDDVDDNEIEHFINELKFLEPLLSPLSQHSEDEICTTEPSEKFLNINGGVQKDEVNKITNNTEGDCNIFSLEVNKSFQTETAVNSIFESSKNSIVYSDDRNIHDFKIPNQHDFLMFKTKIQKNAEQQMLSNDKNVIPDMTEIDLQNAHIIKTLIDFKSNIDKSVEVETINKQELCFKTQNIKMHNDNLAHQKCEIQNKNTNLPTNAFNVEADNSTVKTVESLENTEMFDIMSLPIMYVDSLDNFIKSEMSSNGVQKIECKNDVKNNVVEDSIPKNTADDTLTTKEFNHFVVISNKLSEDKNDSVNKEDMICTVNNIRAVEEKSVLNENNHVLIEDNNHMTNNKIAQTVSMLQKTKSKGKKRKISTDATKSKILPTNKIQKMSNSNSNIGASKKNINRILELFKNMLNFPDEPSITTEVANKIKNVNPNLILKIIFYTLRNDYVDKLDLKYTPPAPPLTATQRVLLGLMLKLVKLKTDNFLEMFMNQAERIILGEKQIHYFIPITRLYSAICKIQQNVQRLRRLCFDALYFKGDLVVPLLFCVLTSWTDVLPLKNCSADIPLAKVLVQVVHLKTCNQPGYNLLALRSFLSDYYGYPKERWNTDEVMTELVNLYKVEPTKSLEYGIIILCKNLHNAWVFEQIEKHFKLMVQANDNPAVHEPVIRLVVNISKQFSNSEKDLCYIENVRTWLNELLGTSPQLKSCINDCLQRWPEVT